MTCGISVVPSFPSSTLRMAMASLSLRLSSLNADDCDDGPGCDENNELLVLFAVVAIYHHGLWILFVWCNLVSWYTMATMVPFLPPSLSSNAKSCAFLVIPFVILLVSCHLTNHFFKVTRTSTCLEIAQLTVPRDHGGNVGGPQAGNLDFSGTFAKLSRNFTGAFPGRP